MEAGRWKRSEVNGNEDENEWESSREPSRFNQLLLQWVEENHSINHRNYTKRDNTLSLSLAGLGIRER